MIELTINGLLVEVQSVLVGQITSHHIDKQRVVYKSCVSLEGIQGVPPGGDGGYGSCILFMHATVRAASGVILTARLG